LRFILNAGAVISGSQSPRHGPSSSCGWRNGLQYVGQLNKQSRTTDKGWSSRWVGWAKC